MDKIWIFHGNLNKTEQEAVINLSAKTANLIVEKNVLIDLLYFYNKDIEGPDLDKFNALGIKTIYSCVNDVFDGYDYSAYVSQLEKLIKQHKPKILLFHSTKLNRIISTYIQTIFHAGLTADCSDFIIKDDLSLIQIRPTYEKRKYAHIITESNIQIASMLFQKYDADLTIVKRVNLQRKVNVEHIAFEGVHSNSIKYNILEPGGHTREKENDIILSGGTGLKSKENYEMLRKLSVTLGAQLGATRPLVEMGWANKSELIGISGSFVTSKLYIAFGISGSIQHLAGINCKQIISINPDENAPINKISNYVILKDATEIINFMMRLCS